MAMVKAQESKEKHSDLLNLVLGIVLVSFMILSIGSDKICGPSQRQRRWALWGYIVEQRGEKGKKQPI